MSKHYHVLSAVCPVKGSLALGPCAALWGPTQKYFAVELPKRVYSGGLLGTKTEVRALVFRVVVRGKLSGYTLP
jgi:hypothetical protein